MKLDIVLCVIFCVTAVSSQCLDGFENHGNNCYNVEGLEASWIEAKMYCRQLGADLLLINDAHEEAIVEGILTRIHHSKIDEHYWTDASDIITEGEWRWMSQDGQSKPFSAYGGYTNWAQGQPDNAGPSHHSNCMNILFAGTRTHWYDQPCYLQHSFICEKRANIVTVTTSGTTVEQ